MATLHIFDMDGTLLDSMGMWHSFCPDFLRSRGISPEAYLAECIAAMTIPQVAADLATRFPHLGTAETIYQEMMAPLIRAYEESLPLFPGMREILEEAVAKGDTLVLLTSSERTLAEKALARTGVLPLFTRLFTANELGMSKASPDIYQRVCQDMGVSPKDTWVHDDAEFALTAAKAAGCHPVPYDSSR